MSKSIIILGRSPFLNSVNVPLLLKLHPSIGFNYVGAQYPVDYLFFYDRWCPHGEHKQIFYPDHLSATLPKKLPPHAVPVRPVRQQKPLLKLTEKDGSICLAMHLFTPSLALNWAILQGYKNAYLVAIDHVETDKQFKHHDGIDYPSALNAAAHKSFKQYVYNCARHIKIFQTNPAVAKDWRLPFMDIEALYGNLELPKL